MALTWRDASKGDHSALNSFVCTNPPKARWELGRGKGHPRPWELDVQSHIRSLHVPVREPQFVILGYDEEGLAAVVSYEIDESDESCMVLGLARAWRCRATDVAGQALEALLARLRSGHHGTITDLAGRVDVDNSACKALIHLYGFEFAGMFDDELEVWAVDITE